MALAPYIQTGEMAAYGISDGSAAQINSATTTINAYLKRPEGLVWSPDANGMPGWMASLTPTMNFTVAGGIAAGANIVVTIPNVPFGFQAIGEVAILDRANSGLAEACVVV